MSLTIQQIITDAKCLVDRLQARDTVANILLNETHTISKKIDTMKQYQEEVDNLNEVANQKPHSQLIANIQKENRHLREIQQENRELRAALEEYENAVEEIMSKYRQHTSENIFKNKMNFQSLQYKEYNDIIIRQAEKIQEMAAVMRTAANLDNKRNENENEAEIVRLKTENRGLREMLNIAIKNGSISPKIDKLIQTENSS